jgi:hypothetical protein
MLRNMRDLLGYALHATDGYTLVIVERPASDSGVLPRFYRLVRFRSVNE